MSASGCWAVWACDDPREILSVHSSELNALRAAVAVEARVVRLPWGMSLIDAIKAAETASWTREFE